MLGCLSGGQHLDGFVASALPYTEQWGEPNATMLQLQVIGDLRQGHRNPAVLLAGEGGV